MFFRCINIIVSWIVRYKVYQYHDIRVFYISLSILYRVLLYCYSLYMQIHNNSLNYMYDNCVHCILLYLVFCSLCAVLCAVLCSLVCAAYIFVFVSVSVCVHIVCGLCAYCCVCCLCAYICLHVYVRMCVSCAYVYVRTGAWGVRLRLPATQSDTPHVGCLCGYRVRIIKAKKTQP